MRSLLNEQEFGLEKNRLFGLNKIANGCRFRNWAFFNLLKMFYLLL